MDAKILAPIFRRALIELARGGIKPANDQLGASTAEELSCLFPDATPLETILAGDVIQKRIYIFGLLEYGSNNPFQYTLDQLKPPHQKVRLTLLFPQAFEAEHQKILEEAGVENIETRPLPEGYDQLKAVFGTIDTKDYTPLAPDRP